VPEEGCYGPANGVECLFEDGEDTDFGITVTLTLGPRAVFAEEDFDALGEVSRLLTVDVDDERRAFAVAIVDDERELAEVLGVAVIAEALGNEVGEIGE
jgi:hypothetical protein